MTEWDLVACDILFILPFLHVIMGIKNNKTIFGTESYTCDKMKVNNEAGGLAKMGSMF